jgi:VanZ family protein
MAKKVTDQTEQVLNNLAKEYGVERKSPEDQLEKELEGGVFATKLFSYLVLAILVVCLLYLTIHVIAAAIGLVLFIISAVASLSA